MITLNEEKRVGACIESLAWADEVIVVDSGSTDATTRIAEELGAKVHFHAWEGFSVQKNYAASLASYEWVLHLDADERVTPELREEIRAVVASNPPIDGYNIPRLNHWLGRPIRHSGWYPDLTMRLFRRGRAHCEGLSHERFIVKGPTASLRSPMVHFSYGSVREHVIGMVASTTLDVEESVRNNVHVYRILPWPLVMPFIREVVLHGFDQLRLRTFYGIRIRNKVEVAWVIPFVPLLRFSYNYFLRQGFRDGIPGFLIAMLSACYEAVRVALLWERLRGIRTDDDVARRTSRL